MQLSDNKLLIQSLFRIRDKRGNLVPLKFNIAQNYYWEKKTRRNLILKARQKGISKIIDADQLVECLKGPYNAVVVSHEKEATERLFAAVQFYMENMSTDKIKPSVSIDNARELKFPKTGASYFIGTAGQKAFGRGDTVHRAHLSEAAFYPDLEKILGGIAEAAEYGQIDIETTPNGREQFYDLWQKAKSGKSSYTPIFIPWFIDGEYSLENLTEKERNGLSASVRAMFDIPDLEFMLNLSPEEKNLIGRVDKEWGIKMTAGQLKWRRYKIWDKGEMFFQEYPEDDVSCFLQSGRSVFTKITTDPSKRIPLDDLDKWKATAEEKAKLKKRRLFGGVDCAEGTPNGDAHCFSVMDIDIDKGKGAVIFEITSNDPIDTFCLKVRDICRDYDIQLAVEKNGLGIAHIRKLKELGVILSEWVTNGTNRPLMISELEEAYRKEDLVETYPEAENEARDMEYNGDKAEAKKGKHDDRIMSRAIAWQQRNKAVAGLENIWD